MPFSSEFLHTEPTREEVDVAALPTVIEFGAPWCGHCMAAQPLIEAAFRRHPDVRHLKIEDGKGRALGRSFRVKLWPTLIFLKDGTEQERLVRPTQQDAIEQALARIA
jgi:thioredoxin 1